MSIQIQPAGRTAAALLAKIHAASFPSNQAWGGAAIGLMLDLPGHFGLLVVDGDVPVGFALGRAQAPEAEILTLAVIPDSRAKGAGWALLNGLIAEAVARNAGELFLEVAESNAAARALYVKAGAQEVGRRRRYYADGGDALVLRITLPQVEQ
ncbi:MAG: ribosomal protein S18-alanine N-acetyltransferase [Alphaproteobacteria bacterium]